uniref:Secreted protein n=1 Tax=Cucumis melo TaxID=3656 RepID=A0A9I9DH55_CUCME
MQNEHLSPLSSITVLTLLLFLEHCCKEETHTIIVHHQREREGDGDATEGELPHCWTNTSPDLRTVG